MIDNPPVGLYGGVLAFNEEARVGPAVRSLLEQELPNGCAWTEVCVMTSGSTDRTADVVRELARRDPRVRLVEQAERQGKSAGIAVIIERCRGSWLVLLNGDARAEPGAVARLLDEAVRPGPRPIAVMARPVPPDSLGGFSDSIGLMWRALHRYWTDEFDRGNANVLLDELMMLSIGSLPPMRGGIVNDGGFVAAWIRRSGGSLRYAPGAGVRIAIPRTMVEFVRQRRRVRAGHIQGAAITGTTPSTLAGLLLHHPVRASGWVLGAARETPRPLRALLGLAVAELTALLLSWWDDRNPGVDFVRWARVQVATEPAGGETRLSPLQATGPK